MTAFLLRGLTVALLCLASSPNLIFADRPNVLLIICDDLNTHVSTSGYPHIHTPAFDKLAAEGMTFRRAYCQYPVCGPSRASFLHGLYPQSTGVLDNQSDIREVRAGTVSMPQNFRDSGYWTGSVGKVFHNEKVDPGGVAWDQVLRFDNDELPMVTPIREKFESENGPVTFGKSRRAWREFYPTIAPQTRGQAPGYGPTRLKDDQHKDGKNVLQVKKWLNEDVNGKRPFFIACGLQKPHVPFLAPEKYFEMYPKDGLKFTPGSLEFWKTVPKLAQTKRYGGFGFEFGVENDDLRRDYIQAYHACISFIDAQVMVMLEALKQSGHWEDTIVILTSDHGYLLGEKFMWGKVMLFEACDRVPLIIRVPESLKKGNTIPGSKSEGLVELIDLYPTLVDLCEILPNSELQGRSLTPMLLNPKLNGKDFAYTVVSRGKELGRAIRTKRYRYTSWATGEELYDLVADPAEEINLAIGVNSKEILAQMRKNLAQIEVMAIAKVRK